MMDNTTASVYAEPIASGRGRTSARRLAVVGSVLLWLGIVAPLTTAAPVYTNWSTPVNVGPAVNSSATDAGPALSPDGLSLYFYSTRPGGAGEDDIYVSQRASVTDAWGPAQNLGLTVNSAFRDIVPAFSTDGHWMFFSSDRPGGYGMADIYASWRPDVHDDFGWQTPVNLGPNVNSSGNDNGVGYFDNDRHPQLFFGSDRAGGLGGPDIYVSNLQPNGTWGPATNVTELNSSAADNRPNISSDGLEIFFYSARSGGVGSTDLWVATRESVDAPWSTPIDVGAPVDTSAAELHPYLSADGTTLLFAGSSPSGLDLDILMSIREQVLPATGNDCKKGGWKAFGIFKNQGDCVSWVATGGKNAAAG